MAWEQGAGFFNNIGNWASGVGQGGDQFMGNFGTGEGNMATWQPFQNVQGGKGVFGKEGGFGSGQGFLSGIGQGDNQFMGQFGTGQGNLANWTPFDKSTENPLIDAPLNETVTAQTTDILSGVDSNPSNDITDIIKNIDNAGGTAGLLGNEAGVSGAITSYGENTQANSTMPQGAYPIPGMYKQNEVPPTYLYQGPHSQEFYDTYGDEIVHGPQTEDWHKENKYNPSNPWGAEKKGWFKKNWDKAGGAAGLLGAMGASVEAMQEGEGGYEASVPSDPLQFYGQDYSNWADVTGGGTGGQMPDATAQGLAGFYMPQIMSMLQSSLPSKS